MKSYLRIFFIIPFLSLVVFSCNKDKGDQLILWVDPSGSQTIESGKILRFTVTAKSDVAITRLLVREMQQSDFVKVIVDTVPGRKEFTWLFEYRAPSLSAEFGEIDLIFEATDSDGNWKRTLRVIGVKTDGRDYLEETTGHVMYSSASEDFNAFDISATKSLIVPIHDSLATIDSSSVNFIDATAKDGVNLSRRWNSLSGCQFVRFNDLDYGSATRTGIKTAFDSGSKRDFVDNIVADDLIITRYRTTDTSDYQYAAIKIIQVIDIEGTELKDRYIFNVKK